jgi:hypothetical protein
MRTAAALSEFSVTKRILAASLLSLAYLSACAPKASETAPDDRYAGLGAQILAWHTALEAGHPACAIKVANRGCESFEVTCKAAQEITTDEAAQGVTAQLVAAMTFNGRNADGSSGKPGSAFALFSKARGAWTRAEANPVNMTSCAPL